MGSNLKNIAVKLQYLFSEFIYKFQAVTYGTAQPVRVVNTVHHNRTYIVSRKS